MESSTTLSDTSMTSHLPLEKEIESPSRPTQQEESPALSEHDVMERHTSKWESAGVVLGTFLANFISVGTANTIGVILHGEDSNPTSPFLDVPKFQMGFVGGFAVGFSFCIGPFSNFLITRFGIRAPVALGVFCMAFALEMASLSSKFWQLLLSQGMLWGIGSSLCFVPAIGLPSQWFSHRKGIATGIASSGAPVGAMILSPVFQTVIDKLGTRWALRILGFILLGIGAIVVVLVHPKKRKDGTVLLSRYKVFDLSIIRTKGYAIYLLFAFIQTFGYAIPVFLLTNYASTLGLDAKQGANIIVILNAGNFIGRISAGQLGDRMGALNVLSIYTFSAGLTCVVGWLFTRTFSGLAAFAFFWGLGAGGYWALTVPCTARIVGLPKLGSAVSLNFLMNFLPPIFAPSIGIALIEKTSKVLHIQENNPVAYRYLIVWSGLSYMFPALLLVIVRFMLERKLIAKI